MAQNFPFFSTRSLVVIYMLYCLISDSIIWPGFSQIQDPIIAMYQALSTPFCEGTTTLDPMNDP